MAVADGTGEGVEVVAGNPGTAGCVTDGTVGGVEGVPCAGVSVGVRLSGGGLASMLN